jgi:hypothetical protein
MSYINKVGTSQWRITLEIVIIWFVCAGICSGVAKVKNLNQGLWTLLGLFFGVFAVVAVLFAKSQSAPVEQSNLVSQATTNQGNLSVGYDVEKLSSLKELLDSGLITKEDYEQQKSKILDKPNIDNSNLGTAALGAAGGVVGFDIAAKNVAKNFIQNEITNAEEGEDIADGISDFF